MASTKKLQVEIVGDSKDLERAFGKAGRAAGDFDKKASRTRKGLKLMGKAAGGAALAIGAGIFAGAAVGVKGLIDDEKAIAKVESTLKSTGGAANVSSKDVQKLAGELQSMSGVGADTIMTNQSLLLSFTNIRNEAGKGNDVFDQATKTMLDMSVALDQDMKSSAVQLGKALNDPVKGITALSRVGVAFTEQQKSQISAMVESGNTMGAQKIILAELNKEFGGTAEALGETTQGKIDRTKRNFEEMAKRLTAAVLPAISALSDWLINVGMPAMERFANAVIATIREWQPYFEAAFRIAKESARAAWEWLEVNVVPTLQEIAATAKVILAGLAAFWDEWGDSIIRVVKAMFAVLSPYIKGAITQIKATIGFVLAVLRGDWSKAWQNLKTMAINPFKTMAGVLKAVLTNLVPALGGIALKLGGKVASKIWQGIKDGPLGQIAGFISDAVTAPFTGDPSLAGRVKGFAKTVGSGLTSSLKTGVQTGVFGPPNLVIKALNKLIGAVDRLIPFVEFSKIPPITAFADGGVVRGPTLGLIGEAGTEVVIPVGSKRKREGRKLLSIAATMLGAPGDVPGRTSNGAVTARARQLGIPMFERGGIVINGTAIGPNTGMMDALIRHQAKNANERNIWEKIGGFFAQGLANVVGKVPMPPRTGGPLFSSVPPAVREMAVHYIRNLFAHKDKFAIGRFDQAKRWAESQMGKPYVWGGGHGGWNYNLPGYDCSGFSSHAAKKAGSSIGGPGTTMSLFPQTSAVRAGGAPMYWGFRGMGGGPRQQHMGTKIYGSWYQFGNPGKKGGTDSQWTHLRTIPGLGSFYDGTPYVPQTGPVTAHRGEAILSPAEAREYRARGGPGGPLFGKLADTVYFTNPTDADVVTSDLAHKVTTRLAAA